MDNLEDLKIQSKKVRERIEQIEQELRQPTTADIDDSAVDESSREVTYRLYQVEKENLAKIEADILKLS